MINDEEKEIRGLNIKDISTFHSSEHNVWDFKYDAEYAQPSEKPALCIFCSTPWTPKMKTIYLESGYCETCFDSDDCHVITCGNCNKIVYRK